MPDEIKTIKRIESAAAISFAFVFNFSIRAPPFLCTRYEVENIIEPRITVKPLALRPLVQENDRVIRNAESDLRTVFRRL